LQEQQPQQIEASAAAASSGNNLLTVGGAGAGRGGVLIVSNRSETKEVTRMRGTVGGVFVVDDEDGSRYKLIASYSDALVTNESLTVIAQSASSTSHTKTNFWRRQKTWTHTFTSTSTTTDVVMRRESGCVNVFVPVDPDISPADLDRGVLPLRTAGLFADGDTEQRALLDRMVAVLREAASIDEVRSRLQ
jgi:hypothetical protein